MKNQGITILQIVITVIILVILASVAIFSGRGIPREANIASIYSETKEIRSAIQEGVMLGKIKSDGEKLMIWDEVELNKATLTGSEVSTMGLDATKEYYRLNFSSSRELSYALELENVSNDYLLDYENLDLYLIKGIDLYEENSDVPVKKYNIDDIEAYYLHTFTR